MTGRAIYEASSLAKVWKHSACVPRLHGLHQSPDPLWTKLDIRMQAPSVCHLSRCPCRLRAPDGLLFLQNEEAPLWGHTTSTRALVLHRPARPLLVPVLQERLPVQQDRIRNPTILITKPTRLPHHSLVLRICPGAQNRTMEHYGRREDRHHFLPSDGSHQQYLPVMGL